MVNAMIKLHYIRTSVTRDFFRPFSFEVASKIECSRRRLHTHHGSTKICHFRKENDVIVQINLILLLAERL